MKRNNFIKLFGTVVMSIAMLVTLVPFEATYACSGFRPGEFNNGVVNYNTPTSSANVELKWDQKLGQGWTAAPTPPTVGDDGYVYVAAGNTLYRLDKNTGEKLAPTEGLKLTDSVGFSTNPMAYADGKLFIQVGNGQVEGVDVSNPKELKHIWTSEKVGGQTISPIVYQNGYIYTGTWNGEGRPGTYICVNAKNGKMQWKHENKSAGYYWAGAYVDDDYAYFGSDSGDLVKVNAITGKVANTANVGKEQIRSTIVKYGNSLYFTTKSGNLFKVDANDFSNINKTDIGDMATGTPSIVDDVVYIGAANGSQFSADAGHKFLTYDVNDMEKSISSVISPGYPQAAPLVKDGQDENFAYFTYNAPPGGMKVLATDDYGEIDKSSYEDLFVPEKSGQQYCICPIMVGKDGTIYYKNDSGHVFALANKDSQKESGLNNITLTGAKMTPGFDKKVDKYDVTLDNGRNSFDLTLDLAKGAKATIDGIAYNGKTTIDLGKDTSKSVNVQVIANGSSKTYVLNAHKQENNVLTSLKIVNPTNGNVIGVNPVFDSMTNSYEAAWTNPVKLFRIQNFIPNKDYVGSVTFEVETKNSNVKPKFSLTNIKGKTSEATLGEVKASNGKHYVTVNFTGNTSIAFATPGSEKDDIDAGNINNAMDVVVHITVDHNTYNVTLPREVKSNLVYNM
ncbi:hypothetical protein HMPREF1635_01295 [Clostridiales bacterium S5-A14a]|nr:hypothetical protein HMPREF1635_01295 [Clostridiales bacterium S5-A14a]